MITYFSHAPACRAFELLASILAILENAAWFLLQRKAVSTQASDTRIETMTLYS